MFHPINAVVYPSASKADAWEDLNLATHVGTKRVIAVLKATNNGARAEIGFKAKGDARNYDGLNFETAFGNNYQIVDAGDAALLFSPTDAAGVVQWTIEGGGTGEVELVGYLDFTYDGATSVGHSLTANTWTDYDFSSVITQDVLAFFVVSAGGGSADNYFAKYKTDPLTNWNATAGSCNYGASEGKLSWDADSMFMIPVKADGLISLLSNVSGVTHTVTLIGFTPMAINPSIIYDDLKSTSFEDQAAGFGSRDALVILSTNQYEGSLGVNYGAHFRPNGNTETWVEGNSRGTTVYSDCTRTSDITHDCKQTIVVGSDGIFEWKLGNPNGGFKTRLYTYGAILGPIGLVSHWPIDDGYSNQPTVARDAAGGGSGAHDGVPQLDTSEAKYQPGGVGGQHLFHQGNSLDGTVSSIANPADFQLFGALTLSAWVAPDTYYFWGGGEHYIVSCSGPNSGLQADNNLFDFRVGAGRFLKLQWQNGLGVNVVVTSTSNILPYHSGWSHVAAERYEVTPGFWGVRFYVNGALADTQDNGGAGWLPPDGGANALPYIARLNHDDGAVYRDNYYDSVRVYDTAIGQSAIAADVAADIAAGQPGPSGDGCVIKSDWPAHPLAPELVGVPGDHYAQIPSGPDSPRDNAGWSEQ